MLGPGASRTRRLIEAARDAHLVGRPASAGRALDDALAGAQDPLQRADIQHLCGRVLVLQGQSEIAYRLLVDEAALVRDADPARTATMLGEACLQCLVKFDLARALTAARDACSAARTSRPRGAGLRRGDARVRLGAYRPTGRGGRVAGPTSADAAAG